MSDWRAELIKDMINAMYKVENMQCSKLLVMTRAALAVAEPVIREQAESALREENARLREALKPFSKNYWADDWHDGSDCEINVQLRDIRRAASLVDGYVWTPDE